MYQASQGLQLARVLLLPDRQGLGHGLRAPLVHCDEMTSHCSHSIESIPGSMRVTWRGTEVVIL